LLSHGRVCFGAAAAISRHEFAGFPHPMETAKERFWECLEVIRKAWTEEQFSYAGKFYQYEDIALLPRPVQETVSANLVAAGFFRDRRRKWRAEGLLLLRGVRLNSIA